MRLVDDRRDLDRAWELARRHDNHPICDMVYAAVAERYPTSLVTADQALRHLLAGQEWVFAPEEFA